MKMNEPLYAIVQRFQSDLAALQDLDLPAEVVADTLEGMQGEVEDKVRAVVGYAIELQAYAEVRAAEAKRMAEGAKRMAERADALKLYAQIALMQSGIKLPLVAPEFTLSLAKNPRAVEVSSVDALPDSMVRTSISISFDGRHKEWSDMVVGTMPAGADFSAEVKPAKKAIGDALKAEMPVEGAQLAPVTYRLSVK